MVRALHPTACRQVVQPQWALQPPQGRSDDGIISNRTRGPLPRVEGGFLSPDHNNRRIHVPQCVDLSAKLVAAATSTVG